MTAHFHSQYMVTLGNNLFEIMEEGLPLRYFVIAYVFVQKDRATILWKEYLFCKLMETCELVEEI